MKIDQKIQCIVLVLLVCVSSYNYGHRLQRAVSNREFEPISLPIKRHKSNCLSQYWKSLQYVLPYYLTLITSAHLRCTYTPMCTSLDLWLILQFLEQTASPIDNVLYNRNSQKHVKFYNLTSKIATKSLHLCAC